MYSYDGLTLEQLAEVSHVRGARCDPELGEGRLPPGSPVVYMPESGHTDGTQTAFGGFLNWLPWPGSRRQNLGTATVSAAPGVSRVRGYPPTAPPAGESAGIIPPAWEVRLSPDDQQRSGNPALGRY